MSSTQCSSTGHMDGTTEPSFVVKIPPNAAPGDPLSFETPDGRALDLVVPDGVEPGSSLRLSQDPNTGSWSCVAELPTVGSGSHLSFDVVVPSDAVEGTMLHHTMDDGRVMDFAVPAGVDPGSILRLTQDPDTKSWGCEVLPADTVRGHSSSSTAKPATTEPNNNSNNNSNSNNAASSEPVTISMIVPPDAAPGSTLTFEIADGRALDIAVPEGVLPGYKLTLTQDPDTKGWSCSAEAPDTVAAAHQEQTATHQEPLSTTVVVPLDAQPGSALPCATPDGKQVDLVLPPGVPGGSTLRLTQDPATLEWGCVVEHLGPSSPTSGRAGDMAANNDKTKSEVLETPRQRRSPEAYPPSKSPQQSPSSNKGSDNNNNNNSNNSNSNNNTNKSNSNIYDDKNDDGSPGGVSESSSLMRRGPKPMQPPPSMLERSPPDGAAAAADSSFAAASSSPVAASSPSASASASASPVAAAAHDDADASPFASPSGSPAQAAAATATSATSPSPPSPQQQNKEEPSVAEEVPVCQQQSIFDLPGGSPTATGRRPPPQKLMGWQQDHSHSVLGTATQHDEATFNPDDGGEVFQGGSLVAPVAESGLPPLMGCGIYGADEDVMMQASGRFQMGFDKENTSDAAGSPIPQLMAGPDDWAASDAIEGEADSREIVQPFSSKQASPGLTDRRPSPVGERGRGEAPQAPQPPQPAQPTGPTSWFQSALGTAREMGNYVTEQLQLPPGSLFGAPNGASSTVASPSKSQKGGGGAAVRGSPSAEKEKQPVSTFVGRSRVKKEFCSDADDLSSDIPQDPTPQLPWQAKPWLRNRENARDLNFNNAGGEDTGSKEKGGGRQSKQGFDPSQVTVWYCKSHNTSSKRPKADSGKVWKCRGCLVEVNTNYKEFAYCQPCSQREMRCMVCGEDAENSSQMLVKPREEPQPQQLQASTVPPRYCEAHSSSERRTKGGGAKYWDCLTCGRQVTTNYQQFSLCPPCSDRDKRCMICGEPAPEAGRYVPPSSMAPRKSNNSQSRWRSDEVPTEKAPQAVPTTFAQKPASMLPTETLPNDVVEEGTGIDVDLEDSSDTGVPGLRQQAPQISARSSGDTSENRWVPQLHPSPFTLPTLEDSLNAASAGPRMIMPSGLPCGGGMAAPGGAGCGFGWGPCSGGTALPVWTHAQHPNLPQPVLSSAGSQQQKPQNQGQNLGQTQGLGPNLGPTLGQNPQNLGQNPQVSPTSWAPPATQAWAPGALPVPSAVRGYPSSPSAYSQQQSFLPQFQHQQQQHQQYLPQHQQQQHQPQQYLSSQQQQQPPSYSPVNNREAIPVATRGGPVGFPTATAAPVMTGRHPIQTSVAQQRQPPPNWGH